MTDNLFLYKIDSSVADRIRRAAGARQMTHAGYVARLVHLHDAIRARADAGDDGLQAELVALGLETMDV